MQFAIACQLGQLLTWMRIDVSRIRRTNGPKRPPCEARQPVAARRTCDFSHIAPSEVISRKSP